LSTLQDLRYKLQKRINRLQSVDAFDLGSELVRFFEFFDSIPIFRAAATVLRAKYPDIENELEAAMKRPGAELSGSTEGESAAIGLIVLRKVAIPDNGRAPFSQYVQPSSSIAKAADRFREKYLNPFYEYIDEQIEDRNVVLAELIRFKHLAEWFRRSQLWNRLKDEPGSGEKRLAFAVYEFLFEQGIDFHIEPSSASGEADMVSAQHSPTPLVADVKIFDPDSSRGSSYIKRGFHQVYAYLQDFNQPIGFLVVFRASQKRLDVMLATTRADEVAYLTLGDKTIFLIQIDIFPHEDSASKRPVPESEVISETDLKTEIESRMEAPRNERS
jgi:hypothetical protein